MTKPTRPKLKPKPPRKPYEINNREYDDEFEKKRSANKFAGVPSGKRHPDEIDEIIVYEDEDLIKPKKKDSNMDEIPHGYDFSEKDIKQEVDLQASQNDNEFVKRASYDNGMELDNNKPKSTSISNAAKPDNSVSTNTGNNSSATGEENGISGTIDFFQYKPQPMNIIQENKYLTTYPYFITPCDITKRNDKYHSIRKRNFGYITIDKIRRTHPEKGSGYTITKKVNKHGYGKVDTSNIWNYITPEQFTKEVNKGAYAYRVKSTGIRFLNINPHNSSTKATNSNNDSTFKKPYLQFISTDRFNTEEPEWVQRKYPKMIRTMEDDTTTTPTTKKPVISWVEEPITKTLTSNYLNTMNIYTPGLGNKEHQTQCKDADGEYTGVDLYYDTKIKGDILEDYGTNINTAPWRHSYLTMQDDDAAGPLDVYTDLCQPVSTEYVLYDNLYNAKSSRGCKMPKTQVSGVYSNGDVKTTSLLVMNKTTILEDQLTKPLNLIEYNQEMPYFDIRDDNPLNDIIPDTLDDDCTYTHVWENPSDNFLIFEDPNLAIFSKEVNETTQNSDVSPPFNNIFIDHFDRANNWDPSRFFESFCDDNNAHDATKQKSGRFNIKAGIRLPIVENDQWQHYNPGHDKTQVKSDMGRSNEGYFTNAKNIKLKTLLVRNLPLPSNQKGEEWYSDTFDPFNYAQTSFCHILCDVQYFAEIEFRYRTTPEGVNRSVLKDSMYGLIPEIVYSFEDFNTELKYKMTEHPPKDDEVYPYSLVLSKCQASLENGKHILPLNNVPYTSSQMKRQEVRYLESKYARVTGDVIGSAVSLSNIDSTPQVVFGTENQMYDCQP